MILLSASFVLAACSSALAQAGSEQSILFSTPDGQTSTNAILPVTQSPQSGESDLDNLPDQSSAIETPQMPGQRAASYYPLIQNRTRKDMQDGTSIETPAEIMGAPSLRQIFGLPNVDASQTNSMAGNSNTNLIPGGTLSGDLGWAKIMASDPSGTASSATNSQSESGMFSGLGDFFNNNNTPAENPLHRKKEEVSDFGAPPFEEAAAQQQTLDSYAQASAPEAPADVPPVAAPQPVFNSSPAFNSPSPFALPKSSSAEQTIPQLPSLPTVSGQYSTPSQPVVPSWAPKPPPWSLSGPTLGTMPQRQF